jgi:hypothetical protein
LSLPAIYAFDFEVGELRATIAVADGLAASSNKQIRIFTVKNRNHAASL